MTFSDNSHAERSSGPSRRDVLKLASGIAAGHMLRPASLLEAAEPVAPKLVAGIATVYHHNSHADVIFGKILEGWKQDGGPGPALKLASMYIDQFPDRDIARKMSKKHGVPIFDSIEKAITVGGARIPVDGVLSIGEHGDYPYNDQEQHLYPRRRFFSEICDTFEKYGRVVPVFNDKHLGPVWSDAQWMYDRAKELKIPFMAGSSLPVGARREEIDLPMGCDIESAVAIGYGGVEAYGFHALEFLQWHVERRRGAERGVKSVQCLSGPDVWKAAEDGLVPRNVFDAALATVPQAGRPDIREDKKADLFLFEYNDGLKGSMFMLSRARGTTVALKLKGQAEPLAQTFDERSEPRYPHFGWLLQGIEKMVHTGRPSYPVERTLLTSGILDRAMTSRAHDNKQLITPELAISYRPVDYPHAPSFDVRPTPM